MYMRGFKARLLFFIIFALFCAFQVFGQDATGKVTGTVLDASGGVVPSAHVTVTNIATGVAHEATTDSNGVYQVLQLPIGRYRVTATAPGFETKIVDSPTPLEINRTLRVDVQL